MEDYIILNAGYNTAINDILKKLEDLPDYELIKERILKVKKSHEIGNTKYEGTLYKYYNKNDDLGFILYDDIYTLKGVSLFVTKGEYKELEEKELIFVKNTMKPFWKEVFENKDLINLRYKNLLNNFKKIEP